MRFPIDGVRVGHWTDDSARTGCTVVLLPDEPYRFTESDAAEIASLEIPAARTGRIHLIDGTWVSWYGPRIQRAISALRPLLAHRGVGE